MIVVAQGPFDDRITLRSGVLSGVIEAIGADCYANACLRLFEQALDAEHWALFRYQTDNSVSCLATASRLHKLAARENVGRFVARCHKVDPSLLALKERQRGGVCVAKIDIEDIKDPQYRHCFETTRVHERLSFFSRSRSQLHQLCIYRGPRRRSFSSDELIRFSALASLVLATAFKHERFCRRADAGFRYLDLQAIEHCFERAPTALSKREREVCARAAAGQTIEATARDLNIGRTSVITYRQRAYQKLGISRQHELVALVNNLRVGGTLEDA